jgi:hypothetical protein
MKKGEALPKKKKKAKSDALQLCTMNNCVVVRTVHIHEYALFPQ